MLGKGATGAVFLGRRLPETPKIVERTHLLPIELPDEAAIKVLILPWQLEDDEREDFHARFVREAQTLQRLQHSHILRVLDYGDDPATGYTYMTMPYMSGGTLAARLVEHSGPPPLQEIGNNLIQIAEALDFAHNQGVVHRDIKPANILLDGSGNVFVADFSIVKLLVETHTRLTSTGQVMGTPEYMAPEQIDGRNIGPSADIYSLGMVVYNLVTGKTAFSATSIMELIRLQTQALPPSPRHLRPDLPDPAEAAILTALQKDPDRRFATAAEFAQAFALGLQGKWAEGLTTVLGSTTRASIDAPTAQTVPNQLIGAHVVGSRRRSRLGTLGIAAAALLILACVTGALVTNASSRLLALRTPPAQSSGIAMQTTTVAAQPTTPRDTATPSPLPTPHSTTTRTSATGSIPLSTPITVTATATPIPTSIPLGTVLYQADWSQGMDGWNGNAHWSIQGGNLVNDGTDDNSTHSWPSIVSPYAVTQTNNYAVETRIQMTTQGANAQCFDVGSVRGTRLASGEWQSYLAAYCTPLGLTIGVVNGTTSRNLISVPYSPGYTPHVYRFEAIGSTLSLYADGQLIGSVQDSTYSSGSNAGLNTYNTGVIVSSYDVIYE